MRTMPDRACQVLRADVLEQEAAGPGRERGVDVLVEVEGGQDDDARPSGPSGRPGRCRRSGGWPPDRPSPASGCPSAPRPGGVAPTASTASMPLSASATTSMPSASGSSGTRCAPAPGRRPPPPKAARCPPRLLTARTPEPGSAARPRRSSARRRGQRSRVRVNREPGPDQPSATRARPCAQLTPYRVARSRRPSRPRPAPGTMAVAVAGTAARGQPPPPPDHTRRI